jgi:hypothetical protein
MESSQKVGFVFDKCKNIFFQVFDIYTLIPKRQANLKSVCTLLTLREERRLRIFEN